MSILSLAEIFGEGAFQDANVLIIQKASLTRLTAKPVNTANSLLAGILVTASENFDDTLTDENNLTITDENNQAITCNISNIYELINIIQWKPFQIKRNSLTYINNQIIILSYAPN